MTRTRRQIAAGLIATFAMGSLALTSMHGTANAADAIKIGEINSYTSLPAFTVPYKQGWELAVEEINAAGGVLGRPLEVISRDDAGKPGDAVRIVEELLSRDKVDLIAGTFFSHIGLAVADVAKRQKVFFMAAEPLSDAMVWSKGNRYTFRLRPSTHMQASMLAEEAAKLPAKTWATIAPNYKYGQDAVAAFQRLLKERRPDVKFVAAQWPALFKIDAGAEAEALAAANPDAIYNVTFGGDLSKFVREGSLRGLFKDRTVVSLLTGEPEYLEPLKDETPDGWIVTGYPWYAINTPEHKAFVNAYDEKFGESPKVGSLVGYNTFMSIAAIIEKAGSTDTEAMVDAAEGIEVSTPIGPITFRKSDHQSTMGAFVGRTAVQNGNGVMVDWRYANGADHLPGPDEVKHLRAGN
ncbi:ABC transporter substrate-binding protein [Hwanghaeella grinnelliae]